MKLFLLVAILIISVLAASACITINTTPSVIPPSTVPSTTAEPEPEFPFENINWILKEYGKEGVTKSPLEGKEVTARFDSVAGKVSGSAGCNSYNATYFQSGNVLTIGSVISTKMLCKPEAIMQQEIQFTDSLHNARTFKADATTLRIMCSEDRVLIFTTK